jgi:hypothetical protein
MTATSPASLDAQKRAMACPTIASASPQVIRMRGTGAAAACVSTRLSAPCATSHSLYDRTGKSCTVSKSGLFL